MQITDWKRNYIVLIYLLGNTLLIIEANRLVADYKSTCCHLKDEKKNYRVTSDVSNQFLFFLIS